jgi:hypothetical protein
MPCRLSPSQLAVVRPTAFLLASFELGMADGKDRNFQKSAAGKYAGKKQNNPLENYGKEGRMAQKQSTENREFA